MKSEHLFSGVRTTTVKSKQREHQEENACTTLTMLPNSFTANEIPLSKERKSSTLELARATNEQTLNVKSKISGKRTRTMMSPKKLLPVSISNESKSIGFWTKSSLEISKRLSLPIVTDLHDLNSSFLPNSARNLIAQCVTELDVVDDYSEENNY